MFNNRRFLEPIGNIPPAEAEQRYSAMLGDVPMAAYLEPKSLRQSGGGSNWLDKAKSDTAIAWLKTSYSGWQDFQGLAG